MTDQEYNETMRREFASRRDNALEFRYVYHQNEAGHFIVRHLDDKNYRRVFFEYISMAKFFAAEDKKVILNNRYA